LIFEAGEQVQRAAIPVATVATSPFVLVANPRYSSLEELL
jgi:hypothetical protein